MNEAQRSAFEGANPGSRMTVESLSDLFVTVAAVLAVIWCAWVVFHAYKHWASGSGTPFEAGGQVLRAFFVLGILLFVVGS